MKIGKNSKFLIIGDSITDAGRARPVGRLFRDGLGNGYVNILTGLITTAYPDYSIEVINMGTGGNTVRELDARWQADVIKLKPDWLSIMIGINDVWRHFSRPDEPENHISLSEYRETLETLIERVKVTLKGLILVSPYFIEPDRKEPMRALMDKYTDAAKITAERHGAVWVDVQKAFDNITEYLNPMYIALDRVHPNIIGHTLIAKEIFKALDGVF